MLQLCQYGSWIAMQVLKGIIIETFINKQYSLIIHQAFKNCQLVFVSHMLCFLVSNDAEPEKIVESHIFKCQSSWKMLICNLKQSVIFYKAPIVK